MQENKWSFLNSLCCSLHKDLPLLARLLQGRDPSHGITPLGYAVAWDYFDEAKVLVKACKYGYMMPFALFALHVLFARQKRQAEACCHGF